MQVSGSRVSVNRKLQEQPCQSGNSGRLCRICSLMLLTPNLKGPQTTIRNVLPVSAVANVYKAHSILTVTSRQDLLGATAPQLPHSSNSYQGCSRGATISACRALFSRSGLRVDHRSEKRPGACCGKARSVAFQFVDVLISFPHQQHSVLH